MRPGYSTMAVTATKAAITGIQGHWLCVGKKRKRKKKRINLSFVLVDITSLTFLVSLECFPSDLGFGEMLAAFQLIKYNFI